MSYVKKKWINVPDPSNPPSIPEGQDSLARFDADNMNRIEDGIEEAVEHNEIVASHLANHGLGNIAKGYASDMFSMLEKGCGFYTVSGASDSPTGSTNWLNLLQLTKEFAEGERTGSGVQIVTDSLPVSNNQGETWIRTIFGGSARNWNKLIHTGNISNYANTRIASGVYSGAYSNSKTLNVIPFVADYIDVICVNDYKYRMNIIKGMGRAILTWQDFSSNQVTDVTWSGNTVTWTNSISGETGHKAAMNHSGYTYLWVAYGKGEGN